MDLNVYQDPDHQAFYWPGGPAAALLIHGFPGTAAEMRPLGSTLHDAGWTVQGLLLPGFGPEIASLPERDAAEWLEAVHTALTSLQAHHETVLLLGYSMGAALSMQVAHGLPPTALVLVSPFWQLGTLWQQWTGFLLRPFLQRMRPFKKADFNNPEVRQHVENILPDVDVDDPDIQAALRELTVPMHMFEQLHRLGRAAYRLAPELRLPTLVMQGTEDEIVTVARTRRLVMRLGGRLRYHELGGDHDIIKPTSEQWPEVQRSLLAFVERYYAYQTISG